MGLRKGQKELVEQYRGGYCAVPAIPGGGKTHCLTLWTVEMIEKGMHRPGRILIVTYMNSAVNNFKQRIAAELQKRGVSANKDYFVSTIHGLCLQIIKEKPDRIFASEEFQIIDEVNKMNLISSSIDEWRRHNEEQFRFYIDETQLSAGKRADVYNKWHHRFCILMLGAIGEFKTRGLTPKEALEKCKELGGHALLKVAVGIYGIYDRRLKISGFLDFDDMLYNAKKMLEEDITLLQKYQEKYSFVCEDEAQDSNRIQSEILTMIANGNLLRVGDSNQAICGSFTNSDFKFFKDFCDLPRTTVYHITQSSRNTVDIINIANKFVKYVRENHPVHECRDSLLPQLIEPVDENDECKNPVVSESSICVGVFKSWEEEAIEVVKKAYQMMNDHPDKTVAILLPSSWQIHSVVGLMEANGIPFEQLDNTSKEKNRTVRVLGRMIDFLALPEDGEKLACAVDECLLTGEYDERVDEVTIKGRKQKGQREILADFLKRYPVEKLLYPMGGEIDTTDIPSELLKMKIWEDFQAELDLVRELLEFPTTVVEKLVLYIAEKLEFGREERAIAQKVAEDVRYLMSQPSDFRLSDLALELLSPKNMFNFFASVVWELKGYQPKPGVVTVSTYHKSKGLEWDIVFLGGLNSTDFPVLLNDKFIGEYWFLKEDYKNPQAILKSEIQQAIERKWEGDPVVKAKIETISEKARLLYVGITRAKQYLFVSGFHANRGRKNEVSPSRYLLEIQRFVEEAQSK